MISKVPDAQVMGDLDATFNWAGANGGDLMHVGVTGFCWGGRQAWLYNAQNPMVKASVAWYGRLVGDRNDLMPKNPIDITDKLHGPVLGLYGGADPSIPLESVEKMKAALATGSAAARRSQSVSYPETPPPMHPQLRPSPRKKAGGEQTAQPRATPNRPSRHCRQARSTCWSAIPRSRSRAMRL